MFYTTRLNYPESQILVELTSVECFFAKIKIFSFKKASLIFNCYLNWKL